jgi:RNA polymerase sigma factor (TIGR02999 family)
VLEHLTPLVYEELRSLAYSIFRRERAGHTLQPTAVVHEAYLRLVAQEQQSATTRAHFFGIAARIMRQVLVDHSRARLSAKRGGGAVKVGLEEAPAVAQVDLDVMALHRALEQLSGLDARKAKMIELRYFGGLTGEEIAGLLEVGTATVNRDLRMAEAWLAREMRAERPLR